MSSGVDSFAAERAAAKKAARWLYARTKMIRGALVLVIGVRLIAFLALLGQLFCLAGLLAALLKGWQPAIIISRYLLPMLALVPVRLLFQGWSELRAGAMAEKQVMAARLAILQAIDRKGWAYLQQSHSQALSLSVVEQAGDIGPFYAHYLVQSVLAGLAPVVVAAIVFRLNWVCGCLLVVTAPAIPVFMVLIGKGVEATKARQWFLLSEMGGYLADRLKGITTLYLFNRLPAEEEAVRAAGDSYSQGLLAVLKVAFLSTGVLEFFSTIAIAGLAVYIGLNQLGYISWSSGAPVEPFTAILILLLAPEFYQSLKGLSAAYHERSLAMGAVMAIQEAGLLEDVPDREGGTVPVMQSKEGEESAPDREEPAARIPCIAFEEVSFGFGDGPLLLDRFSMTIFPGERVRLVGSNGCGKSTLLHLLTGLLPDYQGVIRLNGRDLRGLGPAEIFGSISWLGQSAVVFPGTLRFNVLMGGSMPVAGRWEKMVEESSLGDFVQALPDGWETAVGEGGRPLSGGERQKIALARALLRDTPVLILDEPFTHLDAGSGRRLAEALEELSQDKTLIIVDHEGQYPIPDCRTVQLRNGEQ